MDFFALLRCVFNEKMSYGVVPEPMSEDEIILVTDSDEETQKLNQKSLERKSKSSPNV